MKTSTDHRQHTGGKHRAWLRTGLWTAAALGLAWAVVQRKSAQAERAHPPAGRFVDVDGVHLHYLDRGQGPVMLLLHGNMTMADDFQLSGLGAQLAGDFRVITFDRPGFGYSARPPEREWTPEAQAALLLSALSSMGIGDVLVTGHSWSTQVAVAMALQAPQQVRGVALLGGYYYPGLRMDAMLAAMQRLPVLGTLMRHTVSPLLGRLMWPLTLKAVFSPGAVSDSLRRLPPWLVMRPSQLRATAEEGQLMVPSAARLQWRYAELTMPVTILAGDGDRVVDTQKQSVRLHEALPQSRLRTFAGKGHMLQHVVQREIAEELRALAATAGMRPAAAAPSAGPGPAVSAGMPASGTGMPAVGTGMPASGTGMPATGFSAAPDKQVDGRPVWHPDSSDAGNPLAH